MKDYKQVCVWPGCIVGEENVTDMQEFFLNELGVHVLYIEEIVTKPNYYDSTTGGRNDVFFRVADADISKFAVPRLAYGIRWVEDVIENEIRSNEENKIPIEYSIYPDHVKSYRTW